MFAEHVISLSIVGHQILNCTFPVSLRVIILHVPRIVCHTIKCHLRSLSILHRVACKGSHLATKSVIALIVAIELTHQHMTNAIVVYRVVKPNKRSHTVGSRLEKVQVALVNHVSHTSTGPHHLNAFTQAIAQTAQISIVLVPASISRIILSGAH